MLDLLIGVPIGSIVPSDSPMSCITKETHQRYLADKRKPTHPNVNAIMLPQSSSLMITFPPGTA